MGSVNEGIPVENVPLCQSFPKYRSVDEYVHANKAQFKAMKKAVRGALQDDAHSQEESDDSQPEWMLSKEWMDTHRAQTAAMREVARHAVVANNSEVMRMLKFVQPADDHVLASDDLLHGITQVREGVPERLPAFAGVNGVRGRRVVYPRAGASDVVFRTNALHILTSFLIGFGFALIISLAYAGEKEAR